MNFEIEPENAETCGDPSALPPSVGMTVIPILVLPGAATVSCGPNVVRSRIRRRVVGRELCQVAVELIEHAGFGFIAGPVYV